MPLTKYGNFFQTTLGTFHCLYQSLILVRGLSICETWATAEKLLGEMQRYSDTKQKGIKMLWRLCKYLLVIPPVEG